jgi:hypothetical protein
MSLRIRFVIPMLALTAISSAAPAQVAMVTAPTPIAATTPGTAVPVASPDQAVGPQLGGTQAGLRTRTAAPSLDVARAAVQPPIARKRGVPQMIIGGAALIGGAIIGDDVGTLVMLGGLGYGLYGLYLYLH